MGMLDGMLGGIAGAELVSLVSGLIEKHGGVQGIVTHLQQQGLRETVKSWVGPGQNLPISASQVHQAFGDQTLQELAEKSGIGTPEVAHKLAALLPLAIDKLTPGGTIPQA
jgi:uncharacterized protein YidB (DUF937 family)